MSTEMEKLVEELARRANTTPDMFVLEIKLMLDNMVFPTDVFKKKPTSEQYLTKMAPLLRKELDAEKKVKKAKLNGMYYSKGMNDTEVVEHLMAESQKKIDELGINFSIKKVIASVNPKTRQSIIAKLNEYIRWIDYVDLYKFAASFRGISVEWLEAEMNHAIDKVWDAEKKRYKDVPEHQAFVDAMTAYEAMSKGIELDTETRTIQIPVNYNHLENELKENDEQDNRRNFLIVSDRSTFGEITEVIKSSLGAVRDNLVRECITALSRLTDEEFTREQVTKIFELSVNQILDEVTTECIREAGTANKESRA